MVRQYDGRDDVERAFRAAVADARPQQVPGGRRRENRHPPFGDDGEEVRPAGDARPPVVRHPTPPVPSPPPANNGAMNRTLQNPAPRRVRFIAPPARANGNMATAPYTATNAIPSYLLKKLSTATVRSG